mgnify:CR=1 FL=1
MSKKDNKEQCECQGFYDGAGGCLPYDPSIHPEEPCPPNPFWSWLSSITQEQWIGGTNFGIQMCQLFGGCGNLGAGSYSDPNSQAYMMYIKEQRRKTNTIIIIGLLIAASLFWAASKK